MVWVGWILAVVMALTALLWLGLVLAVARSGSDERYSLAPSEPTGGLPDPPPKVSIIIPARNEEGAIGRAVASSLAQDYGNLEVLVIDDASSDRTAEEAREAGRGDDRLRVEPGRPLPVGWLGKPSACWHGHTLATGEIFLFIDADVVIAPEAVRVSVAALRSRSLDMLSAWGTWRVETFWEKVCQPVVGGFVRGAHPLDQVNDPENPAAFANGQYIMIGRAAYKRFGGHEAVKNEVLEDVRFAQRAQVAGLVCGMFLAPKLFAVRLYTSLGEIWQGMLKNFYHGMDRRPGLALVAAAFVSTTTLLPFVALAFGLAAGAWHVVVAAGLNIALMVAFRFIQDGIVGLSRWYGLTHPLGTLVLVGIILVSMWRGIRSAPTSWKGRPVQG